MAEGPSAPGAARPRVCLSMIVKDEARVLERCLAACLPLIDAAVICDTGSSDGTPAAAERFAAATGLPLRVVAHPWQDFGTNRTRALEAAIDHLERLGWDPAACWLLFLDADQVVSLERPFDPAALSADAYLLAQGNGDERYWNLRLVRADRRLKYVGATHEYLDLPPGARRERLEGVLVTDLNDGGARGDKFERDRRLLTAALEQDPRDARALFYLARTYRALGQRMKALTLFRRRVAAGGWFEEVWHSWFAIAELLREAGEHRAAREALLEARRADPARAEALELLARMHREAGRRERAVATARRGLALPFPADRSLFLDRRTYAYGLRAELARAAAGTAHAVEGFATLDALTFDRAVPPAAKQELQHEFAAYVAPWPQARMTQLSPRLEEPYVACNPCVIPDGAGYLVNCRAVNYRQRDACEYHFPDGGDVCRTRNVLVRLGADLAPLSEHEIHGAPPAPREGLIRGFEDLRLLRTRDGLLATAVTADRHPSGLLGLSVLALEEDGRVRWTVPLTGYGNERHEKNWLPYLGPGGEPRVVYAHEPLTRLAFDPRTGACRLLESRRLPWDLSRWRGSAGPLPFEHDGRPGELVLVHEVSFVAGWRRRYLHRFAWLPREGHGLAVTRPFTFRTLGVEFAAGMCRTHEGDDLLISFGVEDREAWLARLPAAQVGAALVELRAGVQAP